MNIENLFKEKQAVVVDVRTSMEFMGGNVSGSINIPLQEIPQKITEIKSLNKPIIFCCASGSRSEQATQYIANQGIECYNGGSWLDVNFYQS